MVFSWYTDLLIYILSETLYKWWHPRGTLLRFWQNFIYCSCRQHDSISVLNMNCPNHFDITQSDSPHMDPEKFSYLLSLLCKSVLHLRAKSPEGIDLWLSGLRQFIPYCCCLISCYRHYLLAISTSQIWLWEQLSTRPVIAIKEWSRISIEYFVTDIIIMTKCNWFSKVLKNVKYLFAHLEPF